MQSTPDNTIDAPAIRIDSEGVWYYLGIPIERQELVRLFYTVLNKQSDGYYLTTPAENLKITVDDVPYSVVSVTYNANGEVLCTLNDGSILPINEHHHPHLSNENILYVPLPSSKGVSMEARFTRSAYMQFSEHLRQTDENTFVIESFGQPVVIKAL